MIRYFKLTPELPYSGDEDYWTTLLKKISIEFGIDEFDTTLINYGGHSSFEIMSDEKTVADICARYKMRYRTSGDREMLGGQRTITKFGE
jgi:hypothetical protein